MGTNLSFVVHVQGDRPMEQGDNQSWRTEGDNSWSRWTNHHGIYSLRWWFTRWSYKVYDFYWILNGTQMIGYIRDGVSQKLPLERYGKPIEQIPLKCYMVSPNSVVRSAQFAAGKHHAWKGYPNLLMNGLPPPDKVQRREGTTPPWFSLRAAEWTTGTSYSGWGCGGNRNYHLWSLLL